jgi:preprotein translocase subunit SecE
MNPAESIKEWTQNAKQFYTDVRGEMKKVSWPNRQEVIGTTIVVIAATLFFGLYLGLLDELLFRGFGWVLHHFGAAGAGGA